MAARPSSTTCIPPSPPLFPPPPHPRKTQPWPQAKRGCLLSEGFFYFTIFLQGARHEITNWY